MTSIFSTTGVLSYIALGVSILFPVLIALTLLSARRHKVEEGPRGPARERRRG